MVRRRPPKSKGQKSGSRPVDRKDGKMKKWNTVDDIPIDEEDQFHASRDRILLEGEEGGNDDDGDVEEVFALKGLAPSDSDEDETGDEDEDVEEQEMEEDEEELPKKSAKTKSKGKLRGEPTSDVSEEESEEEETWGRSKSAYYSSNAAELESDDEEAYELEEQEAKRLQAKARDAMTEDDFGLGDAAEVDFEDETVEEPLEPPQVITQQLPQDKKSLIRYLEKTSPETLALADDWDDIARKLTYSQEKLKQLETEDSDSLSQGMMHLHYQALLTYATNLAFYLHLRASEKYAQRPEALRTHPMFARLLQLKEALSTLEDLDFDMSGSDLDEDDDDEDLDSFIDGSGPVLNGERIFKLNRKANRLDFEDLAQLLREAEGDLVVPAPPVDKSKKEKSKKKKAEAPAEEPPQKKRKTSTPAALFDLQEPEFVSSKRRTSASVPTALDPMEVYGDAATLGATDAADKSARRKTLRFHTSKIESASARRQGARAALGGDDDVPYRERKKDRDARLAKEAQARGRGQGGDDLDGEEPAPPPRKRARDEVEDVDGSGAEGDDGYYSLIQQQKTERKEAKKAEYDAAKAAAKMDFDVNQSADGPRGLTRAILKNRGLTPHRTKSVRNPRVKKRHKFDKAQKKLASQKAVFKAGPRDVTRYEGEKSGITKVVKSVRF